MHDYFRLVTLSLISFILMQGLGNAFGQNYDDLMRITADFVPDKYSDEEIGFSGYDMHRFSLTYSNNSRLCPSNNCIFQFQGATLTQFPFSPDSFTFQGVLRVGTQESPGRIQYKVYDTLMDLKVIETTESSVVVHKVTGTIDFGQEIEYEIYDGTLTIGGGYLHLDVNVQNPLLR